MEFHDQNLFIAFFEAPDGLLLRTCHIREVPIFFQKFVFLRLRQIDFFSKDRFFFQCWIPKGIMQSTFVNINLSSLHMSYTG